MTRSPGPPLSQMEQCGLAALASAALLALLASTLAALPLAVFLFTCFLAPFFPGWGFFYAVFSCGERTGNAINAIYLTFDDGPDPSSTPLILSKLSEHTFSAAFFVNGKRAHCHPELVRGTLLRGHEIGNHIYSHEPCIMFRSPALLAGIERRGFAVELPLARRAS